MVHDCAMYCGDWDGLQRHKHGLHVLPDGPQEEDQWECDIVPRKGPVPHFVRGVYASLPELSYLRMILQSDGVTLIAAVGPTVQGKGTVDNQNFRTQLILCTNRAAETVLARESSAQEGKGSSTWDINTWLKRWTRTNEHLVGTRTDRVMFFGKEGMITLNVVTIMRKIFEEVESVLDYGFTDLNLRL